MDLWSVGSFAFVALRTLTAVWLLVLAARRQVGAAHLAGQAFADAAAALLLLSYARFEVRETLGWLAIPAFLFFVGWEMTAAARRFELVGDSPAQDAADAELLGAGFAVGWDVLGIAPAFLAGAVVAWDVIVPRQWTFPTNRPVLACTPAVLWAGDTLTLDMVVPHGGELVVLRPERRPLYLVQYPPAGTVPPEQRFEYRERLVLPVVSAAGRTGYGASDERLFVDTGVYVFNLDEYKDPSVAFTCRVRYRGTADHSPG